MLLLCGPGASATAWGLAPQGSYRLFSRAEVTGVGVSGKVDLLQPVLGLGANIPCGIALDLPPAALRTFVGGLLCASKSALGVAFTGGGGPVLGWTRYGKPLTGGWGSLGVEAELGFPGHTSLPLAPLETMLLSLHFRQVIHTDENLKRLNSPDDASTERAFAIWALWETSLDVGLAVPLTSRDAVRLQVRQTLSPVLRRFGYVGRSSAMQFRHVDMQWRRNWQTENGELVAGLGIGHLVIEIEAIQAHTLVPSAHLSYSWKTKEQL